jgi:hypothetical protein
VELPGRLSHLMVLGFRWRRDGWLVGSIVLALLIVGAAALVGSRSGEPAAAPSDGATSGPPTLPEDTRVGRADVVYACVQGCAATVRLVDGREFEIPTDAPSARDITLSPDGRWLGYPLGTGFVLQDLIGPGGYRLGGRAVDGRLAAWSWSADSTLLLLAELRDGEPAEFLLQNLDDRSRTRVPVWPGREVLGVRVPAELLTTPQPYTGAGSRVDIEVSNTSRTVISAKTVDVSRHLQPGERLEPGSLRFTGGDEYEIVVLRNGDDQPVGVVRFGTPAGGRRYDLTDPSPGRWSVLGTGANGRAFVRNGQNRTAVWYLLPNGTFTPGPDLPGDLLIIPPGSARY